MKRVKLFVLAVITMLAIVSLFSCDGGECTEHKFTAWEVVERPGCTYPGLERRYCTKCGFTEQYDIPAQGHQLGEWETDKRATCTKDGIEKRECEDRILYHRSYEIPIYCNYSETRPLPTDGHEYNDWVITKQNGCETSGEQYRQCQVCSAVERIYPEATGHSFGEWKVEAELNCTQDGVKSRQCSSCSKIDRQVVKAEGHTFGEWTVHKNATCVDDGRKTHKCSTCQLEETVTISAIGHSYLDWTTTKEATCTEVGSKYSVCANNPEHTTTEVIPAKGHTYKVTVTGVAATCDRDGRTEEKYCQVCGYQTAKSKTLPKLGHKDANKDIVCDVCGGDAPFVNAIYIYNATDLQNIANDLDAVYVQMANIDMSGVQFRPIGTEKTPFTGRYYGNGYSINGLNLASKSNDTGSTKYIGMFCATQNAVIESLWLVSPYINYSVYYDSYPGIETMTMYAGFITAYNLGGTVFKNCSVDKAIMSVAQKSNTYPKQMSFYNRLGGLCGESSGNVTVDGCYVKGLSLHSELLASRSYLSYQYEVHTAGGFIGKINGEATIRNSYSNGVYSSNAANGLSLATTTVNFGGLVGWVDNTGVVIKNCLSDSAFLHQNGDTKDADNSRISNLFNYDTELTCMSNCYSKLYFVSDTVPTIPSVVDSNSNMISQSKAYDINYIKYTIGLSGAGWKVSGGQLLFTPPKNMN